MSDPGVSGPDATCRSLRRRSEPLPRVNRSGACRGWRLLPGLAGVLGLAQLNHVVFSDHRRAGLRPPGGVIELRCLDDDKPADGFLGLYKRSIAVDIA